LVNKERARIMMKWADLIDQHVEEIAALDAIDAGKLYHLLKAIEVPATANTIHYYAGAADKIHGEVLKPAREFHVSPSLAAGCTMVLKPAEQTPLSALFYAHLAKLAGIPDGVLNVVPGFGATAGAAICSHMDIDKVSFIGSTEVGREVMRAAANSNLKPVSLELGGKSPFIIFYDADLDKAVELALVAVVYNKVKFLLRIIFLFT
ncbi:Aldehyde dehydrogenase family 2 member C4, partial [Glycine soja]